MDVVEIARIIAPLLGLVAVGWILRATGILTAADAGPIHAVIIYAGLPALVFRAVHGALLGPELPAIAAVAWIAFGVSALAAWGISRLLDLPRNIAGGMIAFSALGNTGYIGYPVSQALLGATGLVHAIFYDIFGTVGALLLVGVFIAARFGSVGGPAPNPLREALTFPAVIALGVALIARPVAIPEMVSVGLDSLATLVVPLIMISVGLTVRLQRLTTHKRALAAVAAVKLVLSPLVALVAGPVLAGDPDVVRLVVLEAGMPIMMLSIVFGTRFGLDTEFLASAVLLTTMLSVVTIPVMQMLIA